MNTTEQRAPELHWPAGYPRTPAEERESYRATSRSRAKESFVSIVDELERWGATDVRISTASTHYKDRRTSRTNTTSPPASVSPSASDAKTVPPTRATRSRATVGRPSWRTHGIAVCTRGGNASPSGMASRLQTRSSRPPGCRPEMRTESVVVAGGRVETPPASRSVEVLGVAEDAPSTRSVSRFRSGLFAISTSGGSQTAYDVVTCRRQAPTMTASMPSRNAGSQSRPLHGVRDARLRRSMNSCGYLHHGARRVPSLGT